MQALTVSGYWHNGDILNLTQPPSCPEFACDRGRRWLPNQHRCRRPSRLFELQRGFNGKICRAVPLPPFLSFPKIEEIWTIDLSLSKHWSDPHRPGHLLRLQKGLLFRTTVANTAPASELNTADAWEAVDPFWGKTGLTTTMAFRSRVLEEQPVYYLGTDTGQIWRGSPEVGWQKLCECGSSITGIAPDSFSERAHFRRAQPRERSGAHQGTQAASKRLMGNAKYR